MIITIILFNHCTISTYK